MKMRAHGFTLIELMTSIAVAAVLLALAVPNFSGNLKTSRIQGQLRDLYSELVYARSDAISRRIPVTLCSSNDGDTCSGSWSDGWIICVDANYKTSPGCDGVAEKDTVLRVYHDLGKNTLALTDKDGAEQNRITFLGSGAADTTAALTFALCDVDKDPKYARAVLKVGAGQLLMSSPNAESGIHSDVNNEALTCP